MYIHPDKTARRCSIWLSRQEKEAGVMDPAFLETCREYQRLGYRVCVYVGGGEPLLPHVTALLDGQSRLV